MKSSDLRNKSTAELQETLHELLQEQFNLRMQQGTGQLARPHLMQEVRKNIARVKTIMNEQKGNAS
ncbi:MAG: 50S ribosomal protein L29 [Chromatiales bacterium]|jgi:large subunit ribosomal protein L29